MSSIGEASGAATMLREAEQRQAPSEWNATEADYPRDRVLQELFEAQAAREPAATAVVFEERSLSYGELNQRANQLAHHLRARGVGPDVLVAVCFERSLEMVVGLLAVLKAGGAYVPLDPAYPVERLGFMLRDAAPAALLTHGPARPALHAVLQTADSPPPVIDVIADAASWAAEPSANLPPADVGLTPGHLAYVIYTSGSTGVPKGVMIEHAALLNFLTAMARKLQVTAREVLAAVSPISFDIAGLELWMPLTSGGRTVIVGRKVAQDGAALTALLHSCAATMLQATPATWRALCGAGTPLPSGLTALCGGDALSRDLLDRLRDLGITPWNLYGPTETTIWSLAASPGELTSREGAPTIGRPISNTQVHLLDDNLDPVPVGEVGEIHIGGAGLARGYLRRDALTAEKFIASPFAPGERLYRTGDLGRYRPDGALEFLGRNDFQVKVLGYRIELGEIEARLTEHPSIGEAVVVAREDASGETRLVAYVTADAGGVAGAVEDLRAFLALRLPDYMVPTAYVRLDAFPLTPNGKLDRKALPDPDSDAYARPPYAAPEGEVEQALAAIWSELLGVEAVGRHDNFFDLGGHSLLAVQVIAWVRETLGIEAGLDELFERPMLWAFAAGLAETRSEVAPILPVARDGPLPVSFPQQRLWFLAQLPGVSRAYHIPLAVKLNGALALDALVRALDRMVERHESLRTTFHYEAEDLVQRVHPAGAGFSLRREDLEGNPAAPAALEALVAEAVSEPFDLARGPLIRGLLARLSATEHMLVVTIHHIVADGWSLGVLRQELTALYLAYGRGEDDPLPPLAIQYADYAAWQRQSQAGDVLSRDGAYWRDQLKGAPTLLTLPTDRPRPAEQDFRGGAVSLRLDAELTAGLKALSRRHGVTLFMTLLTGWALTLSRLSGQEDVVIGSPVANRTRSELTGLIGYLSNALALRLDLSGAPTVSELLERVKRMSVDAQAHGELSFEQVVELIQPARSRAHTPVFQVMFAWQDNQGVDLAELHVDAASAGPVAAKFDLTLGLWEADGGLVGALEYASALFDPATAERHAAYLFSILTEMARTPERPAAALAMLPAAERRQVVQDWNQTETDFPRNSCVHELFAAQAARTPEAPAVVYRNVALTYRELDRRANKLARRLQAEGAGPDRVVGLCLERSSDLVVAILAVLKAGAAYVPLDPDYPPERLAFMLQDSQVRTVVTHSSLDGRLPAGPTHCVMIDADWPGIAALDGAAPANGATPSNLAYVIYTSGSTGRPKGVAMEHRPLANFLMWNVASRGDERPFRAAQLAPSSFDVSFQEILVTLLGGGCLFPMPKSARLDADLLYRQLVDHGITDLFAPKIILDQVAARALEQNVAGLALRHMYQAGEALILSPDLRALLERRPDLRLHNHYGSTEVQVATCFTLRGTEGRAWGRVPIGRPIHNVRVYVLDAELAPTPVGVTGDLYVAGAGLPRGYLNRDDLTAEKLVACPFAPDERMYRTGDVGRWRADGTLECLGRNDFQVKIRGFRIELGEIEARLAEHPLVAEAVVLAREDTPGDKRLAAYFTSRAASVAAEDLRAHLAQNLPGHMVPAAYVRVNALPLTPNGKLDRKALPAPAGEAFVRLAYEPPVGAVEQALAEIWADLLGVDQVGRQDNFFDLGGHSLLAVRLLERMRRGLQADLPLQVLFERETLQALAEAVEPAERGPAGASRPAAEGPASSLRILRGGHAQTVFLFHPFGGGLSDLEPVASRLGEAVNVCGVHAFSRPAANLRTMREIAIQYAGEIRERRLEGPYFLMGYSFGGYVATEVARHLRDCGEVVALLGLVDTHPINDATSRLLQAPEVTASVAAECLRLYAAAIGRPDLAPPTIDPAWAPADADFEDLAARLGEIAVAHSDVFGSADFRAMLRLHLRHNEARRSYRQRPYDGATVSYIADQESRPSAEALLPEVYPDGALVRLAATHAGIVDGEVGRAVAADFLERMAAARPQVRPC